MTSTIKRSPMHSASGFVERFSRMQVVPVPVSEAIISPAAQMFVLVRQPPAVLPLLVVFLMLQRV